MTKVDSNINDILKRRNPLTYELLGCHFYSTVQGCYYALTIWHQLLGSELGLIIIDQLLLHHSPCHRSFNFFTARIVSTISAPWCPGADKNIPAPTLYFRLPLDFLSTCSWPPEFWRLKSNSTSPIKHYCFSYSCTACVGFNSHIHALIQSSQSCGKRWWPSRDIF